MNYNCHYGGNQHLDYRYEPDLFLEERHYRKYHAYYGKAYKKDRHHYHDKGILCDKRRKDRGTDKETAQKEDQCLYKILTRIEHITPPPL